MPRGVKKKDPAHRPAVERGIPMQVVDILLDTLGVDEDEVTPDAKLVDDLQADSLDLVELGMAFEAHFFGDKPVVDEAITERWETGTVRDMLADLRRLGAKV